MKDDSDTPRELPSPVLSPKSAAPSQNRSWFQRLADEVDPTFAYIQLLLCCMFSGMCDSVAFNAVGVFVSMQTGNTIFLALGASHLPAGSSRLWLKALVSIVSFQAGAFCFSKLSFFGARRKIVLFASLLVQTSFVIVAAALSQSQVVPAYGDSHLDTTKLSKQREDEENRSIILLPTALLAFQFGGQIVASRVLGFGEIPTNVLTSLYCDLFSDPKLFAGITANPKRNCRIGAAVMTILGGISGGWLQRSAGGMSAVLWIAAFGKLCISISWLFWPSKKASA